MANDGIRIDINQLDFSSGKEISKDDYEYNSMNCGSTYTFWNGDNSRKLYDGINADEAEYIITEFKNAGLLDDGKLDMEEINKFLTSRYNEHFGDGKWEAKGDTTEKAAKELHDLVGLIVSTYTKEPEGSEPAQGPTIDSEKPGLTKQDDGNYTVQIQSWGDKPLEGNSNANDCLYRIMKNYYPNVDTTSAEWKALEKQIMDLNPNIYGTVNDSGEWTPARNTIVEGSRQNSLIYNGESLMLPANSGEVEDTPVPGADEPSDPTDPAEPADPDDGEDNTPVNIYSLSLTQSQLDELKEGKEVVIGNNTYIYDSKTDTLQTYTKKTINNELRNMLVKEESGSSTTTYDYMNDGGYTKTQQFKDNSSKVTVYDKDKNEITITIKNKEGKVTQFTHPSLMNKIIDEANNTSGYNYSALFEMVNNGELSPDDLIYGLRKIEYFKNANNRKSYLSNMNNILGNFSDTQLNLFLTTYKTQFGRSFAEDIQQLTSGGTETNLLKNYFKNIEKGIDNLDEIKNALVPPQYSKGNTKTILDNWKAGYLTDEQALAVLYSQSTLGVDYFINQIRNLGNKEQEQYIPMLQELFLKARLS